MEEIQLKVRAMERALMKYGKYIEAQLTTDERRNKNFWRKGVKYGRVKLPAKLKAK